MSFSSAQKHLFYTEIAKLLEAGFGIREAGRVMRDTRVPARQKALLEEMDADLEAGKTIADAFARNPQAITGMERSIIAAGERGGRLAPAFQHLADYFGMLAKARKEALVAMAYPAVMLHLGLIVSCLVKYFQGEDESLVVNIALTLGALYAAVFVAWLGVKALLNAAASNPAADKLIQTLPLVGGARRAMVMARFTKVYHTALLAGLPMRETAEASAEASRSATIKKAAATMTEVLKEGGQLGPIFMNSGAFPSAFARSYATAEESGSLDKDLARWSKVFQENAIQGSQNLANWLPKIAYFLILLYIAYTILSFYGNMYAGLQDL
ncbi:type II secretion system F family protein [Haloferula sp. BvORR071]|uniref:type II secretion system F family protein n=1 Tax=Haloferula sp. BvORR071 TaxID=1396141 RepID=UPI0005599058|nr:type II secretion system F family protein [Haloferula sp. BvORR071]